MPNGQRPFVPYDPFRVAAEQWPSWTFEEQHLEDDSERFFHDQQVVIIDIDKFGGDRWRAWAHVIVHLEEGHHEGPAAWMTDEQEDLADWLSAVRLDRLRDRDWSPQYQFKPGEK